MSKRAFRRGLLVLVLAAERIQHVPDGSQAAAQRWLEMGAQGGTDGAG
jgi:hypothetical protein